MPKYVSVKDLEVLLEDRLWEGEVAKITGIGIQPIKSLIGKAEYMTSIKDIKKLRDDTYDLFISDTLNHRTCVFVIDKLTKMLEIEPIKMTLKEISDKFGYQVEIVE